MEFRRLGRSGLTISEIAYGNWLTHGSQVEADAAEACVKAALDAGITTFDTADTYANTKAESVLGPILAGERREGLEIFTKVYFPTNAMAHNDKGLGRKHITESIDASLRRLQTDYIDIYWLHNFDMSTPIEETLRTLDDLVTAGKIRYVGLSDLPGWKAAEAQTVAHLRNWTPAIALQIEYSLLERTVEGELIPMAAHWNMGVMPWSPLRSGLLTGKFSRTSTNTGDSRRGHIIGTPTPHDYDVIDALTAIATEANTTPAAAALAWLKSRPTVTSTLIGARHLTQLKANLNALDLHLTPDQLESLNQISTPTLNFPAENNKTLAPDLQFAGTTVDGHPTTQSPFLKADAPRY